MKQISILFLIVVNNLICFGQNSTPTRQSNYSLDFELFLSGVKYASMELSPEAEKRIKENQVFGGPFFGIRDRLRSMGFDYVMFGDADKEQINNIASLCDAVNVEISWIDFDISTKTFLKIKWTFTSCNGDSFEFDAPYDPSTKDYTDLKNIFYNLSIKMYGYKKPSYNKSNRLILKGGASTSWDEISLKEYFIKNGVDAIEGIYENTFSSKENSKYKLGLVKTRDGYDLIYFSGSTNYEDWKSGDLKAKLIPTATAAFFKADWYMSNKSINKELYITFEQGVMNLFWPDREKSLYLKLYPAATENKNTNNNQIGSGTGFAISQNGLIATNHHVVNGSSSIKVRGVNGDFSKTFNAKVVVDDKNNDLAIIKIDDPAFSTLGNIPYLFINKTCDVGTSIFVLGYPLRATMGDEIKLTNGIISSKSGFQGDINSYQITAPVQPGNSGGPLFDDKGNLIGVVNARHIEAENVSYAIKTSYLLNLIDMLTEAPKLQTTSILSEKTFIEQVKAVKQFTFIIEVQ